MNITSLKDKGAEERLAVYLDNVLDMRLILHLLFPPQHRIIYKAGELRSRIKEMIDGDVAYHVPDKTVRENLDRLVENGVLEKYHKEDGAVVGRNSSFYSLNEKGMDEHRLIALSALKVFADTGISPSRVQSKAGGRFNKGLKSICKLKVLLALYNQEAIHSQEKRFRRALSSGDLGPLDRKISDIIEITGIRVPKTAEWNFLSLMEDGLLAQTYRYQRFRIVKDPASYLKEHSLRERYTILQALLDAAKRGEFCENGAMAEFTAREICDRYYGGKSYDSVRGTIEKMEKDGMVEALNHLTRSNPVSLTNEGRLITEKFIIPLYRLVIGRGGRTEMEEHARFFAENPAQLENYLAKMIKIYIANSSSPNRK